MSQKPKATILGKVVHGKKYGRQLGFPTVNLDRRQYLRQNLNIRLGVWAGYAHVLSKPQSCWKAGIVIGPVDPKGLPKIEAHLIGFSGNLYGKKVQLQLHKYIRPFKKFVSIELLKTQIKKDLMAVKKIKVPWNRAPRD